MAKCNRRHPGLPTRHEFYVYELIDPRDMIVFHVGCGSGDRWRTSAYPRMSDNSKKRAALISIRQSGSRPLARIVGSFARRHHAVAFEREYELEAKGRATKATEDQIIKCNGRPRTQPRPWKRRRPPRLISWCGEASEYLVICRHLPAFFSRDRGYYPLRVGAD
jgi:hypothetical protein